MKKQIPGIKKQAVEYKLTPDTRLGMLHIGKTGGTFLKASIQTRMKDSGKREILLFRHNMTLEKSAAEFPALPLVFFVRDPISRYVSAFNSRLRKGQPRYFFDWSKGEEKAFTLFTTPNELAEALSSNWLVRARKARKAFEVISHLKLNYAFYLGSPEFLEANRDQIHYIGKTETMNADMGLLEKSLNIRPLAICEDPLSMHKAPGEMSTKLSELAVANLRKHLAEEYRIFEWCMANREAINARGPATVKQG